MFDRVGELLPAAEAVVVEVGSRTGIWSAQLLDRHVDRVCAVFCVDPFPAPQSNFKFWVQTLGSYAYVHAFPLVGFSLWWAKFFTLPVDLAYVDACHDGMAPLLDAQAWAAKLKPGGALVFHDYDRRWPRFAARKLFGDGNYRVENLGPRLVAGPDKYVALSAWAIKRADGSWGVS